MALLQEMMADILEPLASASRACSDVQGKRFGGRKWSYIPLIILYYCDVPESKDVSRVKHGLSARRPYV